MMKLFSKTKTNLFHPISKKRFAADYLEKTLEDWLEANPQLLGGNLFLIGRQVRTGHGIIDLLALDTKGNTIIIELKRGRASREVIGQLNSYLTIVNRWSEAELVQNSNLIPFSRETNNLIKKFKEHFNCTDAPDFNSKQVGIVVAEEFESDFVTQIGGLRFACLTLQFSSFVNATGEEYLLINTLYDSADLGGAEWAGSEVSGDSEYSQVPSSTRDNFFTLADTVYGLLNNDTCTETDGWRLHKSGSFVQVVFSRWQKIYEGIALYYEPETAKKYIATNCLPKHNKILADSLRANREKIEDALGKGLRWNVSSWETVSEYVGDNPVEIANRIKLYVKALRPYLDAALPPRIAPRITRDVTVTQFEYWTGLINCAKAAGTKLHFSPPKAKGFIVLSLEGQLLVGIASQKRIAVYLAIKGANRERIFKRFIGEEKSILKDLGGEAKFELLPHRHESQIISIFDDGKLLDKTTWPESYKWMLRTFEAYYAVFGPRLRTL